MFLVAGLLALFCRCGMRRENSQPRGAMREIWTLTICDTALESGTAHEAGMQTCQINSMYIDWSLVEFF